MNDDTLPVFDLRPGTDDETVWREHFVEDSYRLRRVDVAGWRCLDLGANVGVVTLDLLHRGAAHVTAVEADPANAEALLDNVMLNLHLFDGEPDASGNFTRAPWPDLTIRPVAAVGDTAFGVADRVGWRTGESTGGGHVAVDGPGLVDAVPIGDLVGDGRWDVVKVDIEGGEYDVLDAIALAGLWPRVDRIVMEFHGHATGQAPAVDRWLRMVGDLAAEGHVETLGAPAAGGLLWWRRYGVEHRVGWV